MKLLFFLTIVAAFSSTVTTRSFKVAPDKLVYSHSYKALRSIENPNKDQYVQESSTAIKGSPFCQGVCLPINLCKSHSVNIDGSGIISLRMESIDPCNDNTKVCCKSNSTVKPASVLTKENTCGVRNNNGIVLRITGRDNEAQYGEFPWMVVIFRVDATASVPNVYQCGGSLIHPSVVLTAAHCIVKKHGKLMIRVGEWDTHSNTEFLPYQNKEVVEVMVHPEFNPGGAFNDIALLVLSSPVTLTLNVGLICLPKQDEVFDTSRCIASGWGKDTYGPEGRFQAYLKSVELPVVPHRKCEAALRNTVLGKYFKLHESFICAGGEPGKDTCEGDGGSPLVCPLKNDPARYEQAGIVAWGIGCGETGTPGVYVNVAKFRKWIDNVINLYK